MSQVTKSVEVRAEWFMANLDVRIYGRTAKTLNALDSAKLLAFRQGLTDFDEGNTAPVLFEGLLDLENEWLAGFSSAKVLSSHLTLARIPDDFSLEDILTALR